MVVVGGCGSGGGCAWWYIDGGLIESSVQFKIHEMPHSLCILSTYPPRPPGPLQIILYYIIYLD